jgi:hypothetical protein
MTPIDDPYSMRSSTKGEALEQSAQVRDLYAANKTKSMQKEVGICSFYLSDSEK